MGMCRGGLGALYLGLFDGVGWNVGGDWRTSEGRGGNWVYMFY